MSTPLFLCHFYCDPSRCRPSTLLIWTIPSCEATQSPGSCSEATHSLPTTDADSGQLLTLSLKALSNRALGCISSLICQKPHSLYSDGTCPMHTLFSLLAPAILLTWDFFSSIFHLCLHALFLHWRSGSDANSCRSIPKDLTCCTFNSSYVCSDLIPSDGCWALLGYSLGILSVILPEVLMILPHICRPSVHMGSIQLS